MNELTKEQENTARIEWETWFESDGYRAEYADRESSREGFMMAMAIQQKRIEELEAVNDGLKESISSSMLMYEKAEARAEKAERGLDEANKLLDAIYDLATRLLAEPHGDDTIPLVAICTDIEIHKNKAIKDLGGE